MIVLQGAHLRQTEQFERLLQRMSNTQTIIYNRLAKTGSSTTDRVIKQFGGINNYTVVYSRIHRYRKLSPGDRTSLIEMLANTTKPWIYIRHFFYIDFAQVPGPLPVYINTVRDPVERMFSEYQWQRRNPQEIQNLWRETKTGSMTFDDCIAKHWETNYRMCFIWNMQNYMMRFFCGQPDICDSPSQEALDMAKRNIEEHYGIIADLTDFHTFFKVLEIIMPQFFKGTGEFYYNSFLSQDKMMNKGHYSAVAKLETTEYLRFALKYEYELYYFIRQRYYAFVQFLKRRGHDI